MRRQAPLRLKRGPSKALSAALVLAHGVSIAVVLALPLPLVLRAVLALLVASHGVWSVLAHGMLRPRSAIVQIELSGQGQMRFIDRIGRAMSAELLPGSVVLPWLVVIRYRWGRERWSRRLLLLGDMCESDALRALRVRLRHPRPATARVDVRSTIPGQG